MLAERIKDLGDLTTAGFDYLILKSRVGGGIVENEQRKISAHMSFALTVWRADMRIPATQLSEYAPAIWGRMSRWVSMYDDVIDNNRSDYPTMPQLKFYKLADGAMASDSTKRLIELVSVVPDIEKKRRIFRTLADFRRKEYALNLKLHHCFNPETDIFNNEIEKLKLESSGMVMQHMARVMNILHGIGGEKTTICEEGQNYLGQSGQYIDDLADFETDAGDPANLLVNASKLYPDEYSKLKREGFKNEALKSCSQTLKYVREQNETLKDKIPASMIHSRRALELFSNLVSLYRFFETKPYI